MRSRWGAEGRAALALACAMAVCAPPARGADHAPVPVVLAGFVGMPADSASRRDFLAAFQDEFDANELKCERRVGEQWSATGERRNLFRLVDVAAPEDAWALELSIGVPPVVRVTPPKQRASDPTPRARMSDLRVSRGLTIVVAAHPPVQEGDRGEPPPPLKVAVYFPDARRVVVPSPKLPGGAYAYPWADAGRVVARAALEALHRADDSLADDERADLSPAVRTEDTP